MGNFMVINIWTCEFCDEKSTDLKNKTKNNKIKCPKCGKENKVPFLIRKIKKRKISNSSKKN